MMSWEKSINKLLKVSNQYQYKHSKYSWLLQKSGFILHKDKGLLISDTKCMCLYYNKYVNANIKFSEMVIKMKMQKFLTSLIMEISTSDYLFPWNSGWDKVEIYLTVFLQLLIPGVTSAYQRTQGNKDSWSKSKGRVY